MRPKIIIGSVVGIVCVMVVYVVGQTLVLNRRADVLSEALVLMAGGDVQGAKDLLACIGPGDLRYDAARRYLALCMHETCDWSGFLKAIAGLDIAAAVVPVEVREELAYRQIDALFRARTFEEIFPKLEAFQRRYSGSKALAGTGEYRLAALFERGMKKVCECAQLTDPVKSAARRAQGRGHLVECLVLAVAGRIPQYTVQPKRDLEQEIWAARLVLGEEAAVFAEVPRTEVARRGRLCLVRLQVYQRLYAREADRLLELMRECVDECPDWTNRAKVEYQLADLRCEQAERVWLETRSLPDSTPNQLASKWAVIRRYHALGQDVAARLLHRDVGVLEQQDYLQVCQDYLNSFYAEGDYEQLAREAELLLGRYEIGSLGWVTRHVYDGIVLAAQSPARSTAADAIFREVLALGFRGKSSFDQWLSCAAK